MTTDDRPPPTEAEFNNLLDKWNSAIALFESYRAEAATPHAGEEFQKFVRALLMRAAECGAFKP